MFQIIDGKAHALKHEEILKEKIKKLKKTPVLVSFLIGNDPSSILYTDIKQKKAKELGIDFRIESNPEKMEELNKDPSIDGIMVQLPSIQSLVDKIDPKKDVDGLLVNSPYLAATVKGILSLLKDEDVGLSDKTAVVVGAKGEVGKRLIQALDGKCKNLIGITQDTPNPSELSKTADILISSTGQGNLITAPWVKDQGVVIDVGSERMSDGSVVGDVDFESVSQKVSKITPVPGGVGPMTVISLMENVVESVENRDHVNLR